MILLPILAVLAANAANLTAQIGAALPGDTITVTGDIPDRVMIRGVYSPPLTLDLTAATLEGGLYVNKGAGVEIVGGLFRPTLPTGAIYIVGGARIHARGITVQQTPGTGYAVTCRNSADVSLIGSTLTGGGVQVNGCQDVAIDGDAIVGFASDGTQVASSQRVTYTRNLCWAGVNDGVHHPDCFQAGGVAGQPGNVDITVRGNEFYGPTQGADDFAGTGAAPVLRLTLSDNVYIGSYPQGIAAGSPGAVVERNHVSTLAGSRWQAKVNLAPGVSHCGNTADAYGRWPAWADAPCPAN